MKAYELIKDNRRMRLFRLCGLLTAEDMEGESDYKGTDDLEESMFIRARNLIEAIGEEPQDFKSIEEYVDFFINLKSIHRLNLDYMIDRLHIGGV